MCSLTIIISMLWQHIESAQQYPHHELQKISSSATQVLPMCHGLAKAPAVQLLLRPQESLTSVNGSINYTESADTDLLLIGIPKIQ
jgi:hypothetical protein